jgi:hypothetical protein
MPAQQYGPDSESRSTDSPATVDENGLVVRNYDGAETHDLRVRFVDPYGETVLDRTVSVAPQETAAVGTRLERAVYCVEVRMENGASASAECLIGSGPGECAMVETGNGRVSVVEGAF